MCHINTNEKLVSKSQIILMDFSEILHGGRRIFDMNILPYLINIQFYFQLVIHNVIKI